MLAMIGVSLGMPSCVGGIRLDPSPSDSHLVVRGVRPDPPPPKPPTAVRVGPDSERLKVEIADAGKNTLDVSVDYNCPFADGELRLIFCDAAQQRAVVTSQPELHLMSNGKGKITFSAENKAGTADWIIVQLKSTGEKCRGTLVYKAALSDFEPGEYRFQDCAIWKVQAYHKVWKA